jgi:hypothetical protein
VSAGEVRVDHAKLTRRDTRSLGSPDDFHCQLVAHDTGVLKVRVGNFEDVVVGATDANSPRSNQRLA